MPWAELALAGPQSSSLTQHPLPARQGTDTDNLFTRIGVRPIINAHGTFTIISGSRSLPQVKQAMFEASHYFVHLDELMDVVGKELGQLTGAEWGIGTTGCEAAIALATIACIAQHWIRREVAGAVFTPRLQDQVIIPKHPRIPYDSGVPGDWRRRLVGSRLG